MFGDPLFRRAETDGIPVMVVKLGERDAAIPWRSLQRKFAIPDDIGHNAAGGWMVLVLLALLAVQVSRACHRRWR